MAWFQVSYFSQCLLRSVPLNVLVPADMAVTPEPAVCPEKYKTLYLLHGYSGNYADWLLKARVQEMSQQFNLAIVMMSGNNGMYVDQPHSGIRGSEYIGREVVEFTRKLFPLSDEREDTIIGGLSMGGYGTLYNALKYSEVFGHAIALSAPVELERAFDAPDDMVTGLHREYFEVLFGDLDKIKETDRNLQRMARNKLESGCELPDLYIACGYNDFLVRDNREFAAYLKSIGFPYTYEEGPGTHDWTFWNEYLHRGLCRAVPTGPVIRQSPFWIEYEPIKEGEI